MNTLGKMILGSDPQGVTVSDDQLVVTLADQRTLSIPLEWISQLEFNESYAPESRLFVLRHPPQIDHVHVTDSMLNVYLTDGRLLACPLAWFPRLVHGTPTERNHYELLGENDVIHWPDLDEDIELVRLFEGGRSLESETSLQHWLESRKEVPSMSPT